VAKALRKDRDARYQTARDLLNDLIALQQPSRSDRPTPPAAAPTTPRGVGRWHGRAALVVGVLALAASVAFYVGGPWGRSIGSVAVLPFVHAGTHSDTEYLADGLTESIISDLSDAPELRVVSRSSVFRFKGRSIDPAAAGRELQVEAVMTGRVEERGDRLEINLELVSVRDNRRLWGKHYNPPLRDLVLVRNEIARDVSAELRVPLDRPGLPQVALRTTSNADAYQLYLKGAFSFRKYTEEGFTQAIGYYLQALQHDPKYALAHVGLAESYISLGADYLPPREVMPKATAHATQAAALDPTLSQAHTALGIIKLVYDWNWPEAERELRHHRALRTDTIESFSCALHYADPVGRNDDAIVALQDALQADPTALPTNLELACASYYGRHYDRAIRQYREALTLYPDHPWLVFGIGRAYSQKRCPPRRSRC
jgi:serine/threonine-protein kinase